MAYTHQKELNKHEELQPNPESVSILWKIDIETPRKTQWKQYQ